MEGIKPLKFTGNIENELRRLKLTERELQGVRKAQAALDAQLKADPVGRRASMYFRAMDDWKNRTVAHWREVKAGVDEADKAHKKFFAAAGRFGLAATGIGGAAYATYRTGRFALDRSKEDNREWTKQRQVGLTQSQSDEIAAEAERQSQQFPSVSQTELRAAGREATMQLGSSEAGLKMMSTIGRFMTSGKVLWGTDKIEEQTRKALQILDARQITDPQRANNLLDALVRSSQVEGGPDFKAEDLRTALRYGRDMTRGQSDRFITGVLPQLGVDMGYPQAGTGLASMHSALIGGRQKEAASEFQRAVGLRNDGGLVGQGLFARDVDRWFDEHFIPAMKKAKVNTEDPAEVAAFNSKFFSNRTAADVAGNMVRGQAQRVRRREQQELAKGMAGAESLHRKDFGMAAEAASAQLANVAVALDKVTGASDRIIGGLNNISEGAGSLSTWLRTGEWPKESQEKWKTHIDSEAYRDGLGGVLQEYKTPYPTGEDPMGSDYSRRQFRSNEYWSGLGREGASAESAARLRREAERFDAAKPFAVPGLSKTMTYGTGAESAAPVTVEGTMEGEGKLAIDINAGSSLIDVVRRAEAVIKLAGQINANGVGSNGKSSPDAAAPAHVGSAGNSPL
ncbi:hypothetical protein CQ12_05550 [Bradyrhizobium jicamae]|uniref:Phage tail tape measure protein domain-containing protein n=1 Tax=Bradyrhizobium jicamae TaxID=280332 RepID=A0A0R3LTJ5_9BRAD|nr:hypothetical protein [Bradyrhizobium jicamae]KRR11292.1 hypothetical protein CQ12_05550 [Bradyrhizobium jicamae]